MYLGVTSFEENMEALVRSEAYVRAMAPATRLSRNEIMRTLGMDGALILSVSPHKKNILYIVKMKPDMEEFVQGLTESMCYLKSCMPRITIFHRRYVECAQMYQMFQQHLGENFTESSGVAKYRLLDMYCKCTEPDMKEAILRAFCAPNGNLWIVIATIAFGMGLCQIIHWSPSPDVESYVQETGRGGRDVF